MTARLAPVGSAPTALTAPSPERARLAVAARQFEAIFVRQMLAAARKSDLGGNLLSGEGEKTFRQMQDEHFADLAASKGAFGLAGMIEAQLGVRATARDLGNGL